MAMIISIHSAARAETRIMEDVVRRIKISIHSAARAETKRRIVQARAELFQSTPPRGRRRKSQEFTQADTYFNPLRREGGD